GAISSPSAVHAAAASSTRTGTRKVLPEVVTRWAMDGWKARAASATGSVMRAPYSSGRMPEFDWALVSMVMEMRLLWAVVNVVSVRRPRSRQDSVRVVPPGDASRYEV